MDEELVYQVRAIDPFGNVRIVHSYESEEMAQVAIKHMMRANGKTKCRYVSVPVKNQPTEHWGLDQK